MKENEKFQNNNRPMPSRPKTSLPKSFQKNESKSSVDSSSKNNAESEKVNQSSSKSITSKGNYDILDSVLKGKQKENFDTLIKEEANRLELIHKQKKNLFNINLYENNIEGLYDWKTLFNNSRPLSCYTRLNENAKGDYEESKKPFKFPIALIDASEDVVAQYIPYSTTTTQFPQSKINKKQKQRPNTTEPHLLSKNRPQTETILPKRKGNATRPQSMFSHREPSETFYLLKPFSDYYNEDLKTFSKKMPLVRAKVFVKTDKLKKTLKSIQRQTVKKENDLKGLEAQKDLNVTPLELNIAGNLKNCKPLLKSIYKQIHPEDTYDFDPIQKSYFKSAKPLGDSSGEIDYSKNNRSGHIEEIRKLQNANGGNGVNNTERISLAHGLSLPTYDENDPDVQIFNRIREASIEEEEHEVKQTMNYIDTTSNNDYIEEHHKIIDYQKNGTKINGQINNKARPKTGIVASGGLFSGRHKQQRINLHSNRPMTANQNVKASKTASIQLNSTELVSSYPNVNSSGSIKDTCASSAGFDFIPVKSMPIRTTSAITNRTYQKIDQNIKNKKKNKDSYLLTEEFSRTASIGENKADVKIQATFRPLSSMYSNEYIKNKLETINKNNRPEWNLASSPSTINYIYFNNFIDTTFLPSSTNEDGSYAKFKHYHEQNYYTSNCFNKGTCGKQLPSKKHYFFDNNNKNSRFITPKSNKSNI